MSVYKYKRLKQLASLVRLPFRFPQSLLSAYVIAILLFACIYWIGDGVVFQKNASDSPIFIKHLYFSIVTITTLGYGDALPSSWPWMIVSAIEALIGVVLLGIFLVAIGYDLARTHDDNQRKRAIKDRDVELAPFYASVSEAISTLTSIRDGNEMAPPNTGMIHYYKFANGQEISVRHVDLDAKRYQSMLRVLGIPAADIPEYHATILESLASRLEASILAASSVGTELQLRISIAEQVSSLRDAARRLRGHRIEAGLESPAALAMCRNLMHALTGPRQLLQELLRKAVSSENGVDRHWAPHYEQMRKQSEEAATRKEGWLQSTFTRARKWFLN